MLNMDEMLPLLRKGDSWAYEQLIKEYKKLLLTSVFRHYLNYNAHRADFLQWEPQLDKGLYDVIVAAPPFINNSDVQHIQKMYKHLGHWGIIITLTTPLWTVNNEPHQVKFREWLKDKKYEITMLPDNTFIEKGKTVPTALLIIRK